MMNETFKKSYKDTSGKGERKNTKRVETGLYEVLLQVYDRYNTEFLVEEIYFNKEDAEARARCLEGYTQAQHAHLIHDHCWILDGPDANCEKEVRVRPLTAFVVEGN